MIIDCHYHLDQGLLPIDFLLKKMEEAGVDKIALMASVCSPIPNVKEILQKLNRFLLTRKLFRGVGRKFMDNFTPEGDFLILKSVVKVYKDPDNQPVFDAIKAHPGKFLGWIFVNPSGTQDQLQEFRKWRDVAGAIGVKAHPFWHRFAPVELVPVAQQVAAWGKPMLLHLGFNEHGNYNALLKEVPDLRLVLAHAAFPYFAQTWKAIKNNPNILVDVSQTMYVNATTTRKVVELLGPDRCLFGTDGPFGSPGPAGGFDLGVIPRRIKKLFPVAQVQAKILGENFLKIIKQ